jgi:hypothetical protein
VRLGLESGGDAAACYTRLSMWPCPFCLLENAVVGRSVQGWVRFSLWEGEQSGQQWQLIRPWQPTLYNYRDGKNTSYTYRCLFILSWFRSISVYMGQADRSWAKAHAELQVAGSCTWWVYWLQEMRRTTTSSSHANCELAEEAHREANTWCTSVPSRATRLTGLTKEAGSCWIIRQIPN